jgi:Arc/MetJ-type ribon-helix-helix transcriptional regulator
MTNAVQSSEVADNAISVRLDDESQLALRRLMERGLSQSEAIRRALIEAGRSARLAQIRLDAELAGADPHDRAVIAEVQEFMDRLAPPW